MAAAVGVAVDAAIVGGGPAGATIAARLARLGHRVLLVEQARRSRHDMGQSLAAGVLPLLEASGAARHVAATGFPRLERMRVAWHGVDTVKDMRTAPGLLVERAELDPLLLAAAQEAGVELRRPARVIRRRRIAGGWRVTIRGARGEESVDARLLVEAGGRGGRPVAPPMLALAGWWRGELAEPIVASGEHGCWAWAMPLGDGRIHAIAFAPPVVLRAMPGDAAHRHQRILSATAVGRALAKAQRCGEIAIHDATARRHPLPAEPDRLRVGEAALALDPLSSSGVLKAVQNALSGAIVANTLLRRPEDAALACRFHAEGIAAAAARHARWTAQLHAPPSLEPEPEPGPDPRALAQWPLALAPGAELVDTPVLEGAFVVPGRALAHPALEAPVARLGGTALAPLIESLAPRLPMLDIARGWSAVLPPERALAIAAWLVRKRVLVEA